MEKQFWDGFFLAERGMQAYLHVFPSSSRVSAPYPIAVRIRAYQGSESAGPLKFDGARLNQADQIDLLASFPNFVGKGLVGLEIVFISPQPSIDLERSSVYVEVHGTTGSTRFAPRARTAANFQRPLRLPRSYGTEFSMSTIWLNAGNERLEIPLDGLSADAKSLALEPGEVSEFSIDSLIQSESSSDAAAGQLTKSVDLPEGATVFSVCRERTKGHPVSVEAL